MSVEVPSNFVLCDFASAAPWIILVLFLLGGLNLPISEDILIITTGALASLCMPEHAYSLYIWTYICCCLASWETYWIGRLYGPKLYDIKWFSKILSPQRIERLHTFYEKYGILVFLIGRFCPGGVRNALFLSSGLGKMPFPTYMLRDGLGALCATAALYYLGYTFGQNYQTILHYFKTYDEIAIGAIISIGILFVGFYFFKRWIQKDI